ncbi:MULTISPECIES: hypothetical protein [unclassified Peribacillus]|uniref:hypothetical protein n=1 Tax=unclassified Peribacillus TaxID=2675266 RepID=UPI00366F35B2
MKKQLMRVGSLCVLLSMFNLNAVLAETNLSNDVNENMDDLPMDLLEELEGADTF